MKNENFFKDNGGNSRTEINLDSGMEVEINKSGINETFNFDNYVKTSKELKTTKLATVRCIPEIIKNGKLIADNQINSHNQASKIKYAYIQGDIEVNGNPVTVKLSIRKSPQKNKFWVHHVYIKNNTESNSAVVSKNYKTDHTTFGADKNVSQNKTSVNSLNYSEEDAKLLNDSAKVFEGDTAKSYVYAYGDNGYKGNVYDYNTGFSAVYMAQQQGKSIEEAYDMALDKGSHITKLQAEIAYDAAQNDSSTAEFKNVLSQPVKIGATVVAKSLDNEQQKTVDFVNEMAKTAGVEVVIPARMQDVGLKDANGAYVNGKIVLPLDNQGRMMNVYLGHEMFHHFKKNVPDNANVLQNYVIEKLKADASYNYEQRLDEVINDYGFKGTREQQVALAHEEMAANACFTVFAEEQNVKQLVKQDATLAQKVHDFFVDLIDRMKKALEGLSKRNKEYNALSKDIEAKEQIVSMFNDCLKESQKNNTITSDNESKYALKEYSEHQIENWENSKKIVIYQSQEQLQKFIDDARAHKNLNQKMYFGIVPDDMAEFIKKETGVDVSNCNVSLRADSIIKIFNDHGSELTELPRGQRPITDQDILNLPLLLGSIDSAKNAGVYTGMNNNGEFINLKSSLDDSVTIGAFKQGKYLDLRVHTMYAKNKKGNYATTVDAMPLPLTPETRNGKVSFDNNVPQNDTSVNSNDMQDKPKYSPEQSQKNNTTTSDSVKYALKEYSEKQIENWKGSKSIVVYENTEQLRAFCETALNDNTFKKKLYFGAVTEDMAVKIKQLTGLDTENLNCCIRADEVRKILKNSHGNEKSENLRGQRAITINDIASIPDIIQNADEIRRSKTDYEGKPVIEFVKNIDGKTTVISYVSKKHNDLTVQTMYASVKGKKNRSLATTPSGDNSFSHTSKTLSGITSTDNVPQSETSVNSNDMQDKAKYSLKEQPYFYEALTSKPDMRITEIDDSKEYKANSQTRKDIINQSIENAKKIGIVNENGNVVVYVDDIKENIIVPKGAIKHSLDRRLNVNAHISLEIGKILKNSIRINEMIPRTDNIEKSYVLIGIAKNKANEPYVVSFVVNKITNEVSSIDVLYAVNAKTEPTGSLSPQVSTPATGSTISISNLLDYVNKYFPDILSEDVLKHYGYDSRPEGVLGESALYSLKEQPIDFNAILEENAELSEMNEDLQQMLKLTSAENEKLKNEFKITDRHNISNNAVDKVAAALRKQYASSYDKSSLVSNLAGLYDYIANAGSNIDSGYIWQKANDIAKNIIANSQQKDTTVYDEYKDLRNRIRNTDIRVPQNVEDNFVDYNDFRRENFGRLRLSDSGIELDAFYNELSAEYPEFFDIDVSEEQQLEALANFFEVTAPVYYNSAEQNAESMGLNMEQYANLIAGDIFDKYFDVPEVMTAAEKHKKEIDSLKLHYRNQIADMRQSYKNRYDERLREVKVENAKRVTKLRADKADALAKQKAHFEDVSRRGKERRKKSQLRASIRKQLNKILNLANKPTKDKHIPIPIIESVRELCNAINLSDTQGDTRIKEKVLNFQSALSDVSSGRYFDNLDNADKAKILLNKKIAVGMTDSERYGILKGKKIYNVPVATNVDEYGNTIIENWNDINIKVGREKQNLINRIATQFGAFKEYSNSDIELDFEFTKNNFRESYNKQGKNFDDFAKMFSVFDRIVRNAVGIEIHNRNKEGYKVDLTLENVYVLVSAFQDGDSIVPVKLEIKQFSDKPNKLYVAVTSDKIKMTEVWKQGNTINGVTQNSRSVNISISDLFKKINPESQSLYKYIPSHFKDGYEDNTDFLQLKSRYANMYNELMQARVEQFISEVGDKTINELSVNDLTSINELLKITITQINNINRLFEYTETASSVHSSFFI